MDSSRFSVAKILLEQLRDICSADNFTCYTRNCHSEIYWMLCCDQRPGAIRYHELMAGPLTHPSQYKRLRTTLASDGRSIDARGEKSTSFGPGVEIWEYLNPLPHALTEDILGAPSFVRREAIESTIRLLFSQTASPDRDHASPTGDEACDVHLFFNFRSPVKPKVWNEPSGPFQRLLPLAREVLLELSVQPRLDEQTAWRLRSTNVRIRKQLENTLVVNGSRLDSQCNELFKLIAVSAAKLLQPLAADGAGLISTSLSLVGANNKITTVADSNDSLVPVPDKEGAPHAKEGVVRFVANSGQIFAVSNVNAYKERHRQHVAESKDLKAFLPSYEECHGGVMSEMACPLIVQGRVVGVLNAEADKENAFDDRHALVLFLLASTAALGVRQVGLWRDIHYVIHQHHQLLRAESDTEIFVGILDVLRMLGYTQSAIWDRKEKTWICPPGQKHPKSKPRSNGFTSQVLEQAKPIAITSFSKRDAGTIDCSVHVGELEQDSGFFEAWSMDVQKNHIQPCDPLREAVERGEVLTDLAFPIFTVDEPDLVRAVLWAKCPRHFTAILPDECWCLSVLCRNATEALQGVQLRSERMQSEVEAARQMLHFQFGEIGSEIMNLPKSERDRFLKVSERPTQVIVMNIDIRGSTRLGDDLAKSGHASIYLQFISAYHDMVRTTVLQHNGIFDKTMGDGVMAIWPIHTNEENPFGIYLGLHEARERALDCVLAVSNKFASLCDKTCRELPTAYFPADFCLGCALVEDEAFIGSFALDKGHPASFSALGPAANNAGKLVSLARRVAIAEKLEKAHFKAFTQVARSPNRNIGGGEFKEVGKDELINGSFDEKVVSWRQGVLLVSANRARIGVDANSFEALLLNRWDRVWRFTALLDKVPCLMPEGFLGGTVGE